MNKFQQSLIDQRYCDPRGAGFCATATRLPNGERGIVCLCVVGNTLKIYDIDLRNNLGQMLYQIKLSEISGLKMRCLLLSQVLKFNYQGQIYSFTNFYGVKPALKVIEEESQKEA